MSTPGDVLERVTLEQLLRRPGWHRQAACRGMGPAMWFPDLGGDVRPAKAICAACPVQEPCAEAGADEVGIWAGLSAPQRRTAA